MALKLQIILLLPISLIWELSKYNIFNHKINYKVKSLCPLLEQRLFNAISSSNIN
jgi:hypothetical protein